jgi:hypothetical protein
MKNYKLIAVLALIVGALVPAYGQIGLSAPIVVRSSTPTAPAPVKGNWLRAEVIHADSNSMVVREQGNGLMIHTFTYTPDLHAKMQKLLDQGGYQYGDKVQILYQHGQTVALRVRGRPSKPL